jgi:hypothetical protein
VVLVIRLPLEPVVRCAGGRRADGPDPRSPGRFHVLGGPGGYLDCLAAGDPRLHDPRYRGWVVLFSVNRPLTAVMARAAKGEALRCYRLA